MAYDEQLAGRVRALLSGQKRVEEKRMFGGITFMLRGNMCCGVHKDRLMVRVGPEAHETLLGEPGARPMDISGRPMKGFMFVGQEGFASDEALAHWVQRGVDFARSLPAK